MEKQRLSGFVEKIIYRNDANGYAVVSLRCEASRSEITVVGCMPCVAEGETLHVTGSYTSHSSYGVQFSAEEIERRLPADLGAIARYLASGIVKGIGASTASAIVERFGDKSLEVIENTPELLCEIKGITPKRARDFSLQLSMHAMLRSLIDYLAAYGLEPLLAVRLFARYGSSAAAVLRENPYLLVDDFFEIDFARADALAMQMGGTPDSLHRAEACLRYQLAFNYTQGHVFLPLDGLLNSAMEMLSVQSELVSEALASLLEQNAVVCETLGDLPVCYLKDAYLDECTVAERLLAMAENTSHLCPRPAQEIEKVSAGFSYTAMQKNALDALLTSGVLIVTGGPGTGKSTIVRGMVALLENLDIQYALAAPTGRAAKRLSELCGREAKTIHRLLECDAVRATGRMAFARNEEKPLDAEVIIVDELSMVDLSLMASLLRAMRQTARIVMVGDVDQLPPVGAGNVLSDCLRSGVLPSVRLSEIFRQAQQSAIVVNAHLVNKGEFPDLTLKDNDFFFLSRQPRDIAATIVDLCKRRLPERQGYHPSDIQVLTPTRRQETGVQVLNTQLQAALNPPTEQSRECRFGGMVFRTEDRVMQVKNNYDLVWKKDGQSGVGVFNGDVGIIRDVKPAAQILEVDYDGRIVEYPFSKLSELELAYAMTVHKAQGSEYKAVIFACGARSAMLNNRSLLYTAMTRARDLLIFVGQADTIRYMVDNNKKTKRFSGLRYRLCREV